MHMERVDIHIERVSSLQDLTEGEQTKTKKQSKEQKKCISKHILPRKQNVMRLLCTLYPYALSLRSFLQYLLSSPPFCCTRCFLPPSLPTTPSPPHSSSAPFSPSRTVKALTSLRTLCTTSRPPPFPPSLPPSLPILLLLPPPRQHHLLHQESEGVVDLFKFLAALRSLFRGDPREGGREEGRKEKELAPLPPSHSLPAPRNRTDPPFPSLPPSLPPSLTCPDGTPLPSS